MLGLPLLVVAIDFVQLLATYLVLASIAPNVPGEVAAGPAVFAGWIALVKLPMTLAFIGAVAGRAFKAMVLEAHTRSLRRGVHRRLPGTAGLAEFLKSVAEDRLYATWWLIALRVLRRGEAAGLRWAVRHRAATLAHAAGADLKTVPEELRHTSIVLTADTYTSVLTLHFKTAEATGVATRGTPGWSVAAANGCRPGR